jgi:hypothetical protein
MTTSSSSFVRNGEDEGKINKDISIKGSKLNISPVFCIKLDTELKTGILRIKLTCLDTNLHPWTQFLTTNVSGQLAALLHGCRASGCFSLKRPRSTIAGILFSNLY